MRIGQPFLAIISVCVYAFCLQVVGNHYLSVAADDVQMRVVAVSETYNMYRLNENEN